MCYILKWYVLCLSFRFFDAVMQRNETGCPTQITYGVCEKKFIWTTDVEGHPLSNPTCLDVHFNVVARNCIDGRWEPEMVKQCYNFRCPKGYKNSPIGCSTPPNNHLCTVPKQTEEFHCHYTQSFFINWVEESGKHPLKFDMVKNELILSVQSSDVQEVLCYAEGSSGWIVDISATNIEHFFYPFGARYHFDMYVFPTYYWCQVFEGEHFHPSVTERVAGKKSGHLFALKANGAITTGQCIVVENCTQFREDLVYFNTGYDNLNESYELILRNAHKFTDDLIYVRSTEFCLPEIIDDLHWELTPIGAEASPDELCLDDDGRILTRKCEGDIISGAVWSSKRVICSDVVVPNRTKFLHEILKKEIDSNVLAELANLGEFSSADVHLLSKGLKDVRPSAGPRNFIKIISNVVRTDLDELRRSQAINSTDELLDSIENFVSAVAVNGPTRIVEDNFIVEITNPAINNVTGLVVYRGESDSFSGYRIVELYANQTLGDLQTDDLELAVMIPENLLRNLSCTLKDLKIIIEIFYNDSLFIDPTDRRGGSKVVGVKIPGVVDLPEPITLVLRKMSDNFNVDCAYWDYGLYRTGRWATDGGATLSNDSLTRCSFIHLTHFALLILSERHIADDFFNPLDAHELYLTTITWLGCALSLIGAIVIFLSAILLKSWHAKRKFTVQLTASVVLELVIFQLAAVDDWQKRSTLCRSIGATLHYAILSKFSWMLLVAYVQHSRFIKIFDNVHLSLWKAIVIGWIAPLLLATLSVIIYSDSYKAGSLKFCHIKGNALYIFLILPIVIGVTGNVAILGTIMIKVSSSHVKKHNKSINLRRRQASLAVLLFFMLGIPWIFGLSAEFVSSRTFKTIFVYIFCLIAPLQGFVMFVFNVLMDANSRKLWKDYMIIKGKSYNVTSDRIHFF